MKRKLLLFTCALALTIGTACADSKPRYTLNDAQPARENKAVLKSIPADKRGADVYKAIMEQYKGKVVLVDLWATWCGPCRMAMKKVDVIKPALQEQGCVFVYVTGETSPKADFNSMYPGIDGDHFYLAKSQWEDLLKQFNATGIPFYLVVGKDGQVMKNYIGYPGDAELEMSLKTALAK